MSQKKYPVSRAFKLSNQTKQNRSIHDPIRILHIISGLQPGGAEIVLYRLLAHQNQGIYRSYVVSLAKPNGLEKAISDLGVPVYTLGMKPGRFNPLRLFKLARIVGNIHPDIMQTWMYHANFLGGLVKFLFPRIKLVWGIHHTDLNPQQDKRMTIWIAKLSSFLSSHSPDKIIYCSESSRSIHTEIGYAKDRMIVIPNGYDLEKFRPAQNAGIYLRRDLRIPPNVHLIGSAARFHPQKDHHTFIKAAGILHLQLPQVQFLLCGNGIDWENNSLRSWITEAGISDNIHLLGLRNDIEQIYPALDIFSTSSSGEAFPNVIAEAMACGVPCVVTDVGDSACIVGSTGIVVPPREPEALAKAWQTLLQMNKEQRLGLGIEARARVEGNYSIATMVENYESIYRALITDNVQVPSI